MCKTENEDGKREKLREFLYQQAINGYQFHVNRYHTWMNYYSIFTGALFVGFCSLTTATTEISKKCSQAVSKCRCMNDKSFYELTNDYGLLIIAVCVLGLISSICWILSLYGHEKWERNWMKNIEYYEDNKDDKDDIENGNYKSFLLYKIVYDKNNFKAFSTHTITKIFIFGVITGWTFCLTYVICKNNYCYYCSEQCCLLIPSIVEFILLMMIIFLYCKSHFYSDVKSKISRPKNNNGSKS